MLDELWRRSSTLIPDAPAVLVVDDEPTVLDTLSHQLGAEYRVWTALDGASALAVLERQGAPAAVISDLRMPGIDGVDLLGQVRQRYPQTSRILHTAQADLACAIAAINEGQVLRLLCKPSSTRELRGAVREGVQHHQVAVAEREILDKTLRTSLQALFGCLQLASPQAFARAGRIRELVGLLCQQLDLTAVWEIEVAAMASQLGAVTVPPSVLVKLDRGLPLPDDEQEMIDAIPHVAARLLADIPRLDVVVAIVKGLHSHGRAQLQDPASDPIVPVAIQVLRVAVAYEKFVSRGVAPDSVLSVLARDNDLDPTVLAALHDVRGTTATTSVRAYRVAELQVGMRIVEDVVAVNGLILIGRGMQVTEMLLERLTNFKRKGQLVEPVLATLDGGGQQ